MKKKSNLAILNFFDQRNIGSIPRIFLSSFLVILTFYTVPILISVSNQNANSYQNNSKAILAYTLNKQKKVEN